MMVTSRTQAGTPLSDEEMKQVSLTENPRIDRILQQVLMRMNREGAEAGEGSEKKPGPAEGSARPPRPAAQRFS